MIVEKDKKERKVYFLIAIIGVKHVFIKSMQLIKYKAKDIYLQMQYRAAVISCKRELKKSTRTKTRLRQQILKFLTIAAIGIGIFLIVQTQLEKSRGYKAIGGEVIFLGLPILWAYGTSLQEGDKER